MREAGLAAEIDGALNVVGRYEATAPGAPSLLLGSHLDSVPDAGRYDGPLGVLCAIEVVARLHAAGRRLPVALEVAAFGDEEGVRFGSDYIGSRALLGDLDASTLALRDDAGTTLAEALAAVGGSPAALTAPVERPPRVGYLELHIEQGPVLEAAGLPLGVVTAIAGQTRRRLGCTAAPATPARCRWRCAPTRSAPPPRSCSRPSALRRRRPASSRPSAPSTSRPAPSTSCPARSS